MYDYSNNSDDFNVCPQCSKEFISSKQHRKYCSDKCSKEARLEYLKDRDKQAKVKNRTCKHCGTVVKSIRKDLHSGGCCKKSSCIEEEKKHRQRLAAKKYYNKNRKKPVRDKKKDAEASKLYRTTHRERVNTKDKYRRKKKREWVADLKRASTCEHCRNAKFYCLDFHHKNPEEKDFSISHGISQKYGKKRILKEIAKCIVLCKNCHSEVHYLMETETRFNLELWLNGKIFI